MSYATLPDNLPAPNAAACAHVFYSVFARESSAAEVLDWRGARG